MSLCPAHGLRTQADQSAADVISQLSRSLAMPEHPTSTSSSKRSRAVLMGLEIHSRGICVTRARELWEVRNSNNKTQYLPYVYYIRSTGVRLETRHSSKTWFATSTSTFLYSVMKPFGEPQSLIHPTVLNVDKVVRPRLETRFGDCYAASCTIFSRLT